MHPFQMWLISKGDPNYIHWDDPPSRGIQIQLHSKKQVSVFTDAVPAVPVLSDVAEHWDEDGVEPQERSDTDVPKERDSL